jgi:hypothetical protein
MHMGMDVLRMLSGLVAVGLRVRRLVRAEQRRYTADKLGSDRKQHQEQRVGRKNACLEYSGLVSECFSMTWEVDGVRDADKSVNSHLKRRLAV